MTKLQVTAFDTFATTAAEWLLGTLAASRAKPLSVGLSGAAAAGDVYEAWAVLGNERRFHWSDLEFFFVDETTAPPQHEDSHCRLVTECLLDHLRSPLPKVFRMETDDRDLWDASERYAQLLPARLDLVVLTVGEDGHVASLFPGDPVLTEEHAAVVTVQAPIEPTLRMTITPPIIGAALEKLVLARGAASAAVVRRVLEEPQDASSLPACLGLDGTWIIDEDAAADLSAATLARLS